MRFFLKNILQFSKVATFLDFILSIWLSFPKIEAKIFNADPCFFNLVKLGTILPAAHFINCVRIGRSQKMAAIIRGLSSTKCFVRFLTFLNYELGKKIYRGALKSRYWSLFVLLLLRSYSCILEVRENIFYFNFYMMNFNQFS